MKLNLFQLEKVEQEPWVAKKKTNDIYNYKEKNIFAGIPLLKLCIKTKRDKKAYKWIEDKK